MFYYTVDENENIMQFAEIDGDTIPAFMKDWLKTDRKIVKTLENKVMFEDEVDKQREQELMLEKAKADKINEFKAIRDAKEVKPISYQGYRFDYDSKARDRISAAIIALELQGEGATIDWTTADNQDVKVTASDLRGIIAQVALRSDKLHTAYRKAKEKVETATTKEEVEAINLF